MNKIECRAVIKFLTKEGKSQKTIYEEMSAVYGNATPSLSTIQKWSSEFKKGRESLEDDERGGGPVSASTEANINKVRDLVNDNCRLKVKQIAEMVGVSTGTVFKILHEHLGLIRLNAKWVPKEVPPPQPAVPMSDTDE